MPGSTMRLPKMRRGSSAWGALTWGVVAALCVDAGLFACQSPALVRTARTLPEGGNDVALAYNFTRVSLSSPALDRVPDALSGFNLVNPIPDILYAHGLTDDFQLGGRLSIGSGLVELSAQYRYVHVDRLHLAVAPAVGYRALALVNGPVFTLPVLITYDLSGSVSLSGGPLVSYAAYTVPRSLQVGDLDLRGQTVYAGAGLGIELRPALGIHIMPSVEVQRSVSRSGDIDNLPEIDMLFLGLTLGWGSKAGAPPPDSNSDDVRAPP
jgi:hypothetical protein